VRSFLRREKPVFNHVALDEHLARVMDKRLGCLGIVFLEEAVKVLAVRGDGDGFRHGACARDDSDDATGGFDEFDVGLER